ncbi:MAG: hypothetical protein GEU87_10640 [Alphaproteobacteria bacterium]|nr:hypothetical protein [Alphaproteobacteria bacterium]
MVAQRLAAEAQKPLELTEEERAAEADRQNELRRQEGISEGPPLPQPKPAVAASWAKAIAAVMAGER